MKVFEVGGQEVVTATLADSFIKHGHHVVIASFKQPNDIMVKRTNPDVSFYTIGNFEYSHVNVCALRKIVIDNHIEIIINQWGLPFIPIRVIKTACKGLNIKVISVYHNQIDTNGKIMAVEQTLLGCNNCLKRIFLKLKLRAVKMITSRSMRYVYNHSDVYEVLSPSFVERFKKFTGIKNPTKLIVQTNPITINNEESHLCSSIDFSKKMKEVIYVGRLDFVQKRVYRVIDTWNYLENKFPDWRLTIVGDGEDRENLENHVRELGLKHITFEGFQNPLEYYKRASVLLLTSDFEGFGLVIVEGMSFGVVPFIYGSYPAVYDIINDKKDGMILPKSERGYDAEKMANMLADLMANPSEREKMAKNAIAKSSKFSLETVYNQWNNEFVKLNSGGGKNLLNFSYVFKEKEIIYVGRLNFVQKRVYRVIDTWNYLEERFPNWRLTIVGDGDDRQNLENHVKALGLKRISFEGFQRPVPYYKRASILLLTSDFEGFPLVLAECMSFGVIPAVYNSYSAVGDIIADGKNGIVIPYHDDGYKAGEAASLLSSVMNDERKREEMALAAIEKSKNYSVENIYHEWENVFDALLG